jgi:hypothetical protein
MDSDPSFSGCEAGSKCADAFALRVISSSDIFIYGAGFYSFFNNYDESCINDETCQLQLIQTSYTQGLWLYDLFTKGGEELVSPLGGVPPTLQKDNNQMYASLSPFTPSSYIVVSLAWHLPHRAHLILTLGRSGFTSEVAAWLAFALQGADIGSHGGSGGSEEDGSGVVYIGDTIFVTPTPTIGCWPPCTLVFPSSTLPTATTISFSRTTITLTANGVTTVTVLIPSPREYIYYLLYSTRAKILCRICV